MFTLLSDKLYVNLDVLPFCLEYKLMSTLVSAPSHSKEVVVQVSYWVHTERDQKCFHKLDTPDWCGRSSYPKVLASSLPVRLVTGKSSGLWFERQICHESTLGSPLSEYHVSQEKKKSKMATIC